MNAFSFVLGVHTVTLGEGEVKTLIHKQMLRIIRPLVESNATHYVYFYSGIFKKGKIHRECKKT